MYSSAEPCGNMDFATVDDLIIGGESWDNEGDTYEETTRYSCG